MKHTPGPWVAENRFSFFSNTSAGPTEILAKKPEDRIRFNDDDHADDFYSIAMIIDDVDDKQKRANACLIAAAPELLIALKLLIDAGAIEKTSKDTYDFVMNTMAKAEDRKRRLK